MNLKGFFLFFLMIYFETVDFIKCVVIRGKTQLNNGQDGWKGYPPIRSFKYLRGFWDRISFPLNRWSTSSSCIRKGERIQLKNGQDDWKDHPLITVSSTAERFFGKSLFSSQ